MKQFKKLFQIIIQFKFLKIRIFYEVSVKLYYNTRGNKKVEF